MAVAGHLYIQTGQRQLSVFLYYLSAVYIKAECGYKPRHKSPFSSKSLDDFTGQRYNII
jgi:hypothetical protein